MLLLRIDSVDLMQQTAMAAATGADDECVAAWYEAYGSGDEREQRAVRRPMSEGLHDFDDEDEEFLEEEECEVEELADDEPMHVIGRLFLGSIDAARNWRALQRARIGGVLALLGKSEEAVTVSNGSGSIGEEQMGREVTRTAIEIEDSGEANLLGRLPGIVAALDHLMYGIMAMRNASAEDRKASFSRDWDRAEWNDSNVLVHCIAGRSRSPSVLAAWMIAGDPKVQSVQDVVDRIRIVRPWIEINPHFMQDLHLFHAILVSADAASLSKEQQLALKNRSFPRLDFGANLVDGILQGTKTITMRLLSDVEDDRNSDLGRIFPYSLVAATSNYASLDGELETARQQFAYLRIDQCDTTELGAIDATTLRKSGFETIDGVLSVLQQFYPTVTTTKPLLMLHFQLICVC